MNKKYTLKQTTPALAEKVQEQAAPAKSRKGVIICLSLLCLLLLGGGIYIYQAMNIEIESLEKSLEYNRTRCIELNEQLKKTEAKLVETERESAQHQRMYEYYAPYEKKFNILYGRLSNAERKKLADELSGTTEAIDYSQQLIEWGKKQETEDADYGLY